MGFLHGRKLLIPSIRAISGAFLIAVFACGGSEDAPAVASADSAAPDSSPRTVAAPDSAVTLVGSLPEGGPMPPAENAAGIPPYPGARVRTSPAQSSELRSFEAFTPDEWTQVVAWFDTQLGPPGWSRLQAEDMVIYEKGEDEAAITVAPWDGAGLQPGVAEYMREARTVIGAAFRP